MRRLHSDQGKEFCNQVLDSLCQLFGITKSQTSAYHPQGNALAERVHLFYRSAISSFVNSDGDNWDELVPCLQLAYNSAIHSSTGVSPYELMYGRSSLLPNTILESHPIPADSPVHYAERVRLALYRTQQLVYDRKALDAQNKREANKGLVLPNYRVGDLVKMEVPAVKPGESKKLKFLWSGPWKISRLAKSNHVYYLEDDNQVPLASPVSVTRLLPWDSPTDFPILEDNSSPPLVQILTSGERNIVHDSSSSSEVESSDYTPMLVVDPSDDFSPSDSLNIRHRGIRVGHNPVSGFSSVHEGIPAQSHRIGSQVAINPTHLGVVTELSVSNTHRNRVHLAVGHEAYFNEEGKLTLKQRLLPSSETRVRKPPAKFKL
jgi:hypothetical protein